MKHFCDLHTHSYYSDGTFSPAEIIAEAEQLGLSAVALCDHNTVDGIPAFLQAGETSPVFAVPGVELSTLWQGKELHILGLFLPQESLAPLEAYTKDYLARKEAGNRDLVDRLQKAGYEVDYEVLQASTPKGKLNRAHVAAALAEKGYVSSIREAFDTLLKEDGDYYVPTERPQALEAIALLRSLSALPVLAHPFLDLSGEELIQHAGGFLTVRDRNEEGKVTGLDIYSADGYGPRDRFLDLSGEELNRFLPAAAAAGLVGMEVLHPAHGREETECALSLCRQYGILPPAGAISTAPASRTSPWE